MSAVPKTVTHSSLALRNLPAFPAVAARVLHVAQAPQVNLKEVAELLSRDAALSAEVLRLANSPLMGTRFQCQSLLQAVSMVGPARIASLAVTVGLSKFAHTLADAPVFRRAWRHNLACALLCHQEAESYNLDPDLAYTYGLLHDIGRLVLLASQPQDYARMVDYANRNGTPLANLERARFGFDHNEAGCWVAEVWGLPPQLIDISLTHCGAHAPTTRLGELVRASCRGARELGFSVTDWAAEDAMPSPNASPDFFERLNQIQQNFGLL